MPLYGNLWGLRMDTKRILANGRPLCLDLSLCIAPISPRVLLLTATRSVLDARSSTSFGNAPAWCSCCTSSRSFPMLRQPLGWGCTLTLSATGGSDGPRGTSPWTMSRDGGVNPVFPPLDHALVKAVACELVAETKQPLSRQSRADVTTRANTRWPNRSVGVRYGGFWPRMPSSHGGTSTGSFLGILTLRRRLDRFWTCMRAPGKANPLAPKTTSSVLMRRPASRPASAAIRSCPPHRAVWHASNTSTSAVGRCNLWPRGTCAGGT
jgi:hypothetical protein